MIFDFHVGFQGAPKLQGTTLVFCGQATEGHEHKMTWEMIEGVLVKVRLILHEPMFK